MAVSKAVVRGILIASLVGSSARGGSMLTLGVAPNVGAMSNTPVDSSASNFQAPWQSTALHLGVFAGNGGSSPVSNPAPMVNPLPTMTQAPLATTPAPQATVATPSPAIPVAAVSPSGGFDAFINFGSGPYPNAGDLTTGNPQPWFLSAGVDRLFGGVPTASQQAAFESIVLQRAQQGFSLSGVPVSLTDNPNATAAHTISVVSQANYPTVSNAIGITNLDGNGFHFIDNSSGAAKTLDQLEWIVAHNVDHELMIAFGVPEVHDTTGKYLDSRTGSWSMMTSPNATFSPDAVTDLLSKNFQEANGTVLYPAAQLLGSPTVPEPTTWAIWGLCVLAAAFVHRTRWSIARG